MIVRGIELERKRRTRTKKRVQTRSTNRASRARQLPRLSPSNRALLAIIVVLYMLHVIDNKALKNFTRSLYPKKPVGRRQKLPKPAATRTKTRRKRASSTRARHLPRKKPSRPKARKT